MTNTRPKTPRSRSPGYTGELRVDTQELDLLLAGQGVKVSAPEVSPTPSPDAGQSNTARQPTRGAQEVAVGDPNQVNAGSGSFRLIARRIVGIPILTMGILFFVANLWLYNAGPDDIYIASKLVGE